MSKYIMRLDDACERLNIENWNRVEELLDKFKIIPIVGVIPHCDDIEMNIFPVYDKFWDTVDRWKMKNWEIAMHGYNHVYESKCGGINPINLYSEFAGEQFSVQYDKIINGITLMNKHNLYPKVFIAPAHTFDNNTLKILKEYTDIKFISDTIAYDAYILNDIVIIPQQTGTVRFMPFAITTCCYHPNTMNENSFIKLEKFFQKNSTKFINFPHKIYNRKLNVIDKFLRSMYFFNRKLRRYNLLY